MDFGTIILVVAIVLFGIALAALMIWAFKAFFGKSGGSGARKAREKRLAIMETFAVDSKRTLYLFRRDDVEHLVMIGGPVDVVVEQGIKARPQAQPHHLNPPHDDVIIAKTEARPPADYGKT
jgi:flagellar protein FliO/FliZ